MTLDIDWSTNTRPQKAIVRDIVFGRLNKRRNALFLPGNGCMCVKSALNHGVISNDTVIHAVERSSDTASVIARKLTKLDLKFGLHIGELTNYKPTTKLDFAFVDLMGPMDENLAEWLRDIILEHSTSDFELSLVFTYNWRNSGLMNLGDEFFKKNSSFIYDIRDATGITDHYVVTTIAMLRSVFSGIDFYMFQPIIYQDSRVSMMVFNLSDFRVDPTDQWPDVATILNTKGKRTMNISKGSQAAYKAWETRRAIKARQTKRSEAAHKAWATRRTQTKTAEQLLFEKRSAAAHKAWATRRAMAVNQT